MKKLMIALAAVATAFGLRAADTGFVSGAGFDTSDTANPENGVYTWLNTDGGGFNTSYWSESVSNATIVADTYTYEGGHPAQFDPTVEASREFDQYVSIKTPFGNPVTMSINADDASSFIGDGFYYDSLVNLTACDEAPEFTNYSDAKIYVYAKQNDPENEGAGANYYVAAADVDGNVAEYKTAKTFTEGGWHRLTVKMIKSVNKAGTTDVGFVVFVDGEALASEGKAAQAAFTQAETENLALTVADWNESGKLFRSLAKDTDEVHGVAYDGQGLIDEVAFTTTAPDFAADPSVADIKFGDTIAKLYVNDGTTTQEFTGSPAAFVYDSAKTYYYWYDATAKYVSLPEAQKKQLESFDFTIDPADEAKAKIGNVNYASVDEAITVAGDTDTVVLLADADAITVTKTFTLDLAGYTIKATSETDSISVTAGALKIIDSAGTGKVDIYSTDYCAVTADGGTFVTIEAGEFDGAVMFTDAAPAGALINGGKFLVGENAYNAKDTLDPYAKEGYEFTQAYGSDYLELTELAAKASVIFICDKTSYNQKVEADKDGYVTPPKDAVDAKPYYQVLSWREAGAEEDFNFDTPLDPGVEKTVYAVLDINLAMDVDGAYEVGSVDDITALKDYVNDSNNCEGKTFKQTENITFPTGDDYLWKGIGSKDGAQYFGGIYDGNNKTIENVKFDAQAGDSNSYMGFFRYVINGTIKDLTVESDGFGNVPKFFGGEDYEYGGAVIVGIAENATLSGLTAEGNIGTETNPTTHNAGGVAVEVIATTVENCVNKAALHCAYSKAAGIVVFANPSKKLNNDKKPELGYKYDYDHGTAISGCSNQGDIFGYQCWTNTLGLCKADDEGALKYKDVAFDGYAGILAWVGDSTRAVALTNNVNTGSITADGGYIGGVIGKISNAVTGEGNRCAEALPIVGTFFAAQGTDFWYESIAAGTATQDKTPLAVGQTRVIAAGSGNSNANLPKPVLALATGEDITFITNLCATALNFSGITALDGAKDKIKEEVVAGGVKFTAEALPPPGPQPTGDGAGSVDPVPGEDGVYVVTGDPSSGNVSIDPATLKETDRIRVTDSTIGKITGVPANQIEIKLNGVTTAIDQKYFVGMTETGFSLELSNEAKAQLVEETEDDKPLVIGDNVDVTISTVAGLKYQLIRGAEVGEIETELGEPVVGDGQSLTLKDNDKPEGKAFYVIRTTK